MDFANLYHDVINVFMRLLNFTFSWGGFTFKLSSCIIFSLCCSIVGYIIAWLVGVEYHDPFSGVRGD